MILSYYPGCTLKNKAQDLDRYGRLSAQALGVTLQELDTWQCCGGVYPMAKDEIATKLSSVRSLMAARDRGQDLVTLCSACHNVLKQVNNDMRTDPEIADKVNRYMAPEVPYQGETRVIHYLELLRDVVGWDAVKAAVKHPFTGKKIGAYYGCLLLRPGKVMAMDNPENPAIMEDFIRAIGGEPVIYPLRNECCGGYVTLENKALADSRSAAVLDSAVQGGADELITACPLCLYNLNRSAGTMPVRYFTELLAEALGVKEGGKA